MVAMLTVLEDVVKQAVAIEVHGDRYVGTERQDTKLLNTFVLISAFKNRNSIIPVKLIAKELRGENNKIHVAITAKKIESEIFTQGYGITHTTYAPSNSIDNISIPDLIQNINVEDEDLLKYVPDGLLNKEQKVAKEKALDEEKEYIKEHTEKKRLHRNSHAETSDDDEAVVYVRNGAAPASLSTNSIPQSEENTQGNDGEQYARKKANKQKSDKQTERETPLRGNINSQETTENYGKTAEAREKIKRSEHEAGKDIQSIINEIGKTFKINIFSKRYRKGKGVLGFYDKNHQIIHSQNAQQLGVVVHELGHHLDNIYSLEYDDAIKDILSNAPSLRQSLEDAGYSADEMPAEVFADFIWHYLTMPDSAYEMGSYAKGENFYDTFERSLSKEDLKKLQHIRSMLLSF